MNGRIYIASQELVRRQKNYLDDMINYCQVTPKDVKLYVCVDYDGSLLDLSRFPFLRDDNEEILSSLPLNETYRTVLLRDRLDGFGKNVTDCVTLLSGADVPLSTALVLAVKGVDEQQFSRILDFFSERGKEIRGVDERLPSPKKQDERFLGSEEIEDFANLSDDEILSLYEEQKFTFGVQNLLNLRQATKKKKKNITYLELEVLEMFWGEKAKRNLLLTDIKKVSIDSELPHIKETYDKCLELAAEYNLGKRTLYDFASLPGRYYAANGELGGFARYGSKYVMSVEVNVGGNVERWELFRHNSCGSYAADVMPDLGSSILLSENLLSCVSGGYTPLHVQRISLSGDPSQSKGTKAEKFFALERHLSISTDFSDYMTRIGVQTGANKEYYSEAFAEGRVESDYVVGARKEQISGFVSDDEKDAMILLVGKTTMNEHTAKKPLAVTDSETMRKLAGLFSDKRARSLMLAAECVGSNGIVPAAHRLTPSFVLDLEKIFHGETIKSAYDIISSETTERVLIAVSEENCAEFTALCSGCNLQSAVIGECTADGEITLRLYGKEECRLPESLVTALPVSEGTEVRVVENPETFMSKEDIRLQTVEKNDEKAAILSSVSRKNGSSQAGLGTSVDTTSGFAALMPFGGKDKLIPSPVTASFIPTDKQYNAVVLSSNGIAPSLTECSPFVSSVYANVIAINKLVASGVETGSIKLSPSYHFGRLSSDEEWGKAFSAMLGNIHTQLNLGIVAINSPKHLEKAEKEGVPVVIAYATGVTEKKSLISNIFKAGQKLFRIKLRRDDFFIPDFKYLKKLYTLFKVNVETHNIEAAAVVENDIVSTVLVPVAGEGLGFSFAKLDGSSFAPCYGDFIVAVKDLEPLSYLDMEYVGVVRSDDTTLGMDFEIKADEIVSAYSKGRELVYPTASVQKGETNSYPYIEGIRYACKAKITPPNVLVPSLYGISGRDVLAERLRQASAKVNSFNLSYLRPEDAAKSVDEFVKELGRTQILALPNGRKRSEKYFVALMRNPKVTEAVLKFLDSDGLILGVGSSFDALLHLGLIPFGTITEEQRLLYRTFNDIGRYTGLMSNVKITSNLSPWLFSCDVGETYSVPIATVDGKLIATDEKMLKSLILKGCVATQFVDDGGNVTMEYPYNPTGSVLGIESMTSPDGRILGTTALYERLTEGQCINLKGDFDAKLFESGVRYFA